MADLSVKGIARRFRHLTGAFSVMGDLFPAVARPAPLRSRLMPVSTLPVKRSIPDCGTTIDQGYTQIWTHIIVRVKLVPHNMDNLPTPLEQWKDYLEMGIEGIWNRQIPLSFPAGAFHTSMESAKNKWQEVPESTKNQSNDPNYWNKHWMCSQVGEAACRLSFEVQWVESDEHHSVNVGDVASTQASDESNWPLLPSGFGLTLIGAAHEFGHMLGLSHDRIPPKGCEIETQYWRDWFTEHSDSSDFPWYRTVMCAVSGYAQLPINHVQQFADAIGSEIKLVVD